MVAPNYSFCYKTSPQTNHTVAIQSNLLAMHPTNLHVGASKFNSSEIPSERHFSFTPKFSTFPLYTILTYIWLAYMEKTSAYQQSMFNGLSNV